MTEFIGRVLVDSWSSIVHAQSFILFDVFLAKEFYLTVLVAETQTGLCFSPKYVGSVCIRAVYISSVRHHMESWFLVDLLVSSLSEGFQIVGLSSRLHIVHVHGEKESVFLRCITQHAHQRTFSCP